MQFSVETLIDDVLPGGPGAEEATEIPLPQRSSGLVLKPHLSG